MLVMEIPGRETLKLVHLVLDYNGTLACDGEIKNGVLEQLEQLADQLQVHVITADTHGSVQKSCQRDFINIHVIANQDQDVQKKHYITQLGADCCVAIGNGFNDAYMLKEAALGMTVMQEEGCAVNTLMASDLAFYSITEALNALLKPKRIVASLRNA